MPTRHPFYVGLHYTLRICYDNQYVSNIFIRKYSTPMMTLDQLRYFVAAARYEHIGRAAESIPISASVISQAVKQLEDDLGCELFIRENRRVRLTSHGLRLLDSAGNLLNQAEAIKQDLSQSQPILSGHYRIGGSTFLASKVLTPVISKLQKTYPDLTADILSQPTWAVIDSVLAGRLDLGIGFGPLPHPQLEFEEIFSGKSVVVVRKNHPILKRPKASQHKDLHKYPATVHMAADRIVGVRNHPVLKSLAGRVSIGFDSDYVALENVCQSDNWAFMIDMIATEFSRHLQRVPLPNHLVSKYTVQIIRHKSRKVDSALLEIMQLVKAHIADIAVQD